MWQAWYEFRIDYALFSIAFLVGHAFVLSRVRRAMPPASSTHPDSATSSAAIGSSRRARLSFCILLLLLTGGFLAVETADRLERSRLRQQVFGIAPTYAAELQQLGHAGINEETSPDDPVYLRMINAQKRWLSVNPQVTDIYTMRRLSESELATRLLPERDRHTGHPFQIIVDSETDYNGDGKIEGVREEQTEIGEIFTDSSVEQIERAFRGDTTFADQPSHDRWGEWVSAYAPLFDSQGNVEALVGVDFPAKHYIHSIILTRLGVIGMIAALITLFLGAVTSIGMLKAGIAAQQRSHALLQDQRDLATQAASQARQAAVTKNQFLANMSHEIRTPMHGILGTTELMTRCSLNEEQRHYMHMIQTSAKGLLTVLNDILDFSKVDSGLMTLESVPFELKDLLSQTMHAVANLKNENVQLQFQPPVDVPEIIIGDPTRLRQVLINLVGNALKFTEQGRVTVLIEKESQDATTLDTSEAQSSRIVFTITDTGIGMTEQQRANIFEAFTQGDSSTTRRFGGTGLGLSISSQLVELMGGQLQVSSVLDEGSSFRFDIPLRTPIGSTQHQIAKPQPPTAPANSFGHCDQTRELLLVEDGAINRTVAETMLRARGHRVTSVSNAKDALKQLRSHAFDLVLMDVQMPEIDGLTATQIIRNDLPSPARDIPVIALTAHAMREDRQRCLDAGMNECLTKPYPPELLFDTIESFAICREDDQDDLLLPPTTNSKTSSPSSHADRVLPLNHEVILQNVGGDLQVLAMLAQTISAELPSQIDQLHQAIHAGDSTQVALAAHTLKGTAAAIGATQAQEIAASIETFSLEETSQEESLQFLDNRMNALVSAFELAQTELKSFLLSSSGSDHPGNETP
ncbi:hybrid sensor histidine kinase/response regulator [Rhodopirellula sp. P2]|uniref:hybrid sensor histidine kinase/response regulator n=1 Tax=Rhodopirellula sp. P2 TaxID=2127060 RepID=UPI0023688F94|nr:ATP-binding protein [Rhodopirellula sp. P2]WDQ17528.1 ATP-binding protein [Rhodopirellula sp. P2]